MPMGKQYGPPRRPSEYRPPVGINSVPPNAQQDAEMLASRFGLQQPPPAAPTPPAGKTGGGDADDAQTAEG